MIFLHSDGLLWQNTRRCYSASVAPVTSMYGSASLFINEFQTVISVRFGGVSMEPAIGLPVSIMLDYIVGPDSVPDHFDKISCFYELEAAMPP